MVHYRQSYRFGKEQEKKVHPYLKEFFKRDIIATTGQYDKYDFYDETANYELKSRTNAYAKYPDTMITMNKCCNCDKDKDLYLLFNFTDGLYYIQFDEEKFAPYRREMFSRADRTDDEKEHIFIPIRDLSPIVIWGQTVMDCGGNFVDVPIVPALSKSGGF
jgi:hypothetical protein